MACIPAGVRAQLGNPIEVQVRSSGTSWTDDFPASTDFAHYVIQDVPNQLGVANLSTTAQPNNLRVTFTPQVGATGA